MIRVINFPKRDLCMNGPVYIRVVRVIQIPFRGSRILVIENHSGKDCPAGSAACSIETLNIEEFIALRYGDWHADQNSSAFRNSRRSRIDTDDFELLLSLHGPCIADDRIRRKQQNNACNGTGGFCCRGKEHRIGLNGYTDV